MARGNETTTKFKVDISELKKGIQDANRQIKLANAEFKAASASMENWGKSTDGLTAKITQTEKVLKAQKKILNDYKKQLALIVAEYGENSKEADEMRIKIENQRATVIRSQKALGDYKNELTQLQAEQQRAAETAEKQENAYDSLKTKIGEQEKELQSLKAEYSNLVLEQGKDSEAARNLASQIDSLSGDLRDNKQALGEADSAADEFDNSLGDLEDSADSTGNGFTVLKGAIANLVSQGIQMAISAIKDFAKETLNVGKNFDSSMSQVGAVSGAAGDDLDKLREKAKEMGSTTKFTASEAAEAFNYMAMAGWKTEEMISGIDGIMNLAAASGADLATSSDIVTDALTAMGYSAKDAGRLADVMAAASSNANTNVEMMGETFKYAAPLVGAMGYSMEDTAKAIGLMANAGIKGSQAGTSLRSILTRLTTQPKECAAEMNKLGLSLTDSEGQMKSLDEVMQELRVAFADMSETEQTAAAKHIAGAEAMSGLLAIVNAAPSDFDKLTDAINNSDGAAETMANAMLDNLGGDMTLLSSKLEGVQLAIYEKFEPALRKGAELLNKLLDAVQFVVDHSDEFIAALVGMATAVGTYLAYTTAMKVMTEGWKALTIVTKAQAAAQAALNFVMSLNPIGLIIAAIAGLVAAFVVLWKKSEKFRNFWLGLWDEIKGVAEPIIKGIAEWFSETWDKIKNSAAFDLIVKYFQMAWKNIQVIWDVAVKYFKMIWDNIKLVFSAVKSVLSGDFSGAWDAIKKIFGNTGEFFSEVWQGIKDIFGNVGDFFGNAFSIAKDKITGAFSKVGDWFKENWKSIIMFILNPFSIVFKFLYNNFEGFRNFVDGVWEAIKTGVSNLVQPIIDYFQPVITFFTEAWNIIKELAAGCWEAIKAIWGVVSEWFNANIIQPVATFFSDLWNGVKTAASTTWTFIKGVWAAVSGWFKNTIIMPVSKWFSDMWDGLKKKASDAWDGIKSVFMPVVDWFKDKFSKAWKAVKDVFSTGGQVFEGIKDGIVSAFKTVVNAIIRGINRVITIPFNAINGILDRIQGVSIAGIQPFEFLNTRLTIPQIPELEKGGVLKKGQLGLLEGNGAEAVVPLENNKKWIAATAYDLKKALYAQGIIGEKPVQPQEVVNNYNFTQNNTSPKALSRLEIYRQSKNLLSWKGAT